MNQVECPANSTRERALKIIERLKKIYKRGEFSDTPFRVLITTVLSHRTKDEKTAKARGRLFESLPTVESVAEAPLPQLEELIKDVGFYRVKAQRIKQIAQIIKSKFAGKVPSTEEELLSLPGVGRKTVGCVLAYGFGKAAVPVDTHLHRVSNLLGIVNTKTAEQTEEELKKIVPKTLWIELNELFVKFGKDICRVRRPRCSLCPIRELCPRWK
jgi:endonuclease-3